MKRLDQLTVVLFLLVTLGLAALFWVIPDRNFSPLENRSLQSSPTLSLENLAWYHTSIPWTDEVSIGHALIADALYIGLEETVNRYQQQLK